MLARLGRSPSNHRSKGPKGNSSRRRKGVMRIPPGAGLNAVHLHQIALRTFARVSRKLDFGALTLHLASLRGRLPPSGDIYLLGSIVSVPRRAVEQALAEICLHTMTNRPSRESGVISKD